MNDIERAIEYFEDRRGYYLDDKCRLKYYDLAISALEKQLNCGWIPVSERLPQRSIPVLVSDKQENVCVRAITCEIKGKKYWSQDKYDVLAWMPLPEPWKEVENE